MAEAKGSTSRFLQVYDEYKKAPDSGAGQGVVPYLPLNELTRPRPPTPPAAPTPQAGGAR